MNARSTPEQIRVAERPATSKQMWALWGAAAALLGAVAHLIADPQGQLLPEERQGGAAVIGLLQRTPYHVGAVAGFLAVLCLLVAAAGWWRWADERSGGSLAARLIPLAFSASAGAMIIGYGFKGSMAVYLPGGINATEYPDESLLPLFMINDLGPFMAWWGVAVAAAGMVWLTMAERRLPRWMGAISILALLPIAALLFGTGLTGSPGLTGPLWLLIVSIGMAVRREPSR